MTARYVANEVALREALLKVLETHAPRRGDGLLWCACGAGAANGLRRSEWEPHQATAATAALLSTVVQPREDAVREANAGCFGRWPLDRQPVAALLGPEHDGHALRLRSTGVTWEGDGEIETRRFTCSCGARVNVETRIDVGAPGTDRPAAEDGPRNTGTGSV